MGCDHENTAIKYTGREEVSKIEFVKPDGSTGELKSNYTIAEPRIQCTDCNMTRELSQREKDKITPEWK